MSSSKKRKILFSVLVSIITLSFLVFHYYLESEKSDIRDEFFLQAMEKNNTEIQSVLQHIETKAMINSGPIEVVGDYINNKTLNRFWSRSTTTISSQKDGEEVKDIFALNNISIGQGVYTKIQSDSEFIKSRGLELNRWLHFSAENIPERYTGISIVGPVMDNLRLFKKNGLYLDLLKKYDNRSSEEKSIQYTLLLSDKAFTDGQDDLGMLPSRLGKDGTINVWIDKETLFIKRIELAGSSYSSNTEIKDINHTSAIEAPLVF